MIRGSCALMDTHCIQKKKMMLVTDEALPCSGMGLFPKMGLAKKVTVGAKMLLFASSCCCPHPQTHQQPCLLDQVQSCLLPPAPLLLVETLF